MNPGDRIAYKASFLRNIGDYSYATASRRGTVTGTWRDTHVEVKWDDSEGTKIVHAGNLILANRIHLEAP